MFVFFKQETAYVMRISDWSSDVCSSDLVDCLLIGGEQRGEALFLAGAGDFLDARGIARGRTNAKFALLERRRLRARGGQGAGGQFDALGPHAFDIRQPVAAKLRVAPHREAGEDRKSTRLNSSH